MKYFTPERYLALQNMDEAAMDAADADWEKAVEQYATYLQSIRAELPESVKQLLDGFYLHNADVLSMGQRDDTFVISLQIDVPPNDLLTISYSLAGKPDIRRDVFPVEIQSSRPQWLYEELEMVGSENSKHFVHSILFSNGWQINLPFRDVQTSIAFPMFPAPRSVSDVSSTGSAMTTR